MAEPALPERGVTIRPGEEGFVARIWPSPPLDRRVVGGGMVVFTVLAIGGALAVPASGSLRVQVAASVLLFGGLLVGASQAIRFAPVEIGVERQSLSWNGERIPWTLVARAHVDGPRLQVLGDADQVLAEVIGARPEVARWLAHELDDAVAEIRGGPASPPTG